MVLHLNLNVRLWQRPFAAGIGGIVGGLLHVSLYIAQNCIMAIPAFIGEKGMSNLLYGIIMIVVSFVASFVLTFIFGFEDAEPEQEEKKTESKEAEKTQQNNTKPLVEKIELCAPVSGTVKALSDVPDKTFAEKYWEMELLSYRKKEKFMRLPMERLPILWTASMELCL